MPDIGHGDGDQFSKSARPVHANPKCVGAEVATSSQTVATATTDDMPFGTDEVPGMKIDHVRADFDDLTNKFVSHNHGNGNGFLSPRIPVVDMQVGTANARFLYTYQTVIDANGGLRDIFQGESF